MLNTIRADHHDSQLVTIALNFILAGGTLARWISAFDRAEEMSRGGHYRDAGDGQPHRASSRRPMPDGGQHLLAGDGLAKHASVGQPTEGGEAFGAAPKGQPTFASSPSPQRNGGGHMSFAYKGHSSPAAPVREPTAQQRSIAAAQAKAAATLSIMDTIKIDGLALGDWTITNALKYGKTVTREGFILIGAARKATERFANIPGNTTLRILRISDMQEVVQRAAELSDAI